MTEQKQPLRTRFTEEYLDLMLEWGTIADIPAMVAEIRRLNAELKQAKEGTNERHA